MSRKNDTAMLVQAHNPSSACDWVVLAYAADRQEAEMCARILEEGGIPARLASEAHPQATVALALLSGVEIRVPAELELQAGELLAGRLSEQQPVCDGEDEDDFGFDDTDEDEFDDDEDEDAEEEDFDDFDDDLDEDEDDDLDVDDDDEDL